ncbi:VOC family protein [Actinokineospora sp. UTMC 2448]|uniref:VOC family protein n=1 Tax=Actinokineospora sp. UTMC 2448 TaxID=2268449 RepID=UPI002164C601|nr:VOC family protein [Actinokineospora sp. UTMC 2448]UVS78582.1 Glyoxalase-like domain protein [Actinokineospora sp. UTMC 2448]
MRVMPIRYSSDVAGMTRFYEALGLAVGAVSRPGGWVELPAAGGLLAIHRGADEDAGRCELAFEADEPLEDVAARLRAAGFAPGPVIDENHGHSLRVQDPDGVWVQINLYDRQLYT